LNPKASNSLIIQSGYRNPYLEGGG
jgi:hypothetical protein